MSANHNKIEMELFVFYSSYWACLVFIVVIVPVWYLQ